MAASGHRRPWVVGGCDQENQWRWWRQRSLPAAIATVAPLGSVSSAPGEGTGLSAEADVREGRELFRQRTPGPRRPRQTACGGRIHAGASGRSCRFDAAGDDG